MPRGQKECPKCNKPTGPRTKICDCGYVYLQDSVDTAKVGKKPCSNCSKEMESDNYNTDPYGKVTYFYKWDSYCSVSCLEAASERKDDLILEFLNKIKETDNEELNSFILDKRNEEDYRSLIEDVEKRAAIEAEEAEYRKIHPYIVYVSNPVKRLITPEECREVGLEVPPKIGEHVHLEPEDDNPLRRLLKGSISIDEIENEQFIDSDLESEESDESEETSEEATANSSSNLLSNLLFGSNKAVTKFVQSAQITQVQTTIPQGIVYDASTKPRQGQKKCKTCGLIVGVRLKQCTRCNYKFPPKV